MVFQVIPVAFCILLTVTHAVFGSELVAEPTEHKVFKVPEPRYRLPTTFLPFHYDLKLLTVLETLQNETQLTQWTAPGSVTILGTCVHATTNITLHSQGLQINETSVKASRTEVIENLCERFELNTMSKWSLDFEPRDR
jgi:hypothetical protein